MAEAKLIDGKAHAARLRERVAKGVADLIATGGPAPGLATVLIDGDPASQVYVRSKSKMAAELGMTSFDHRLSAETSEAELLALIGRSNLVGRPVAQLLLRADCTVTIAHSRTRDLAALSRQADIVVAAIGRPEFVRGEWIKPGAAVIDVGINRVPTEDGKSQLV